MTEGVIMPATATTAEIAEAIGTDTRTLRKFLRDDQGDGKAVVGKGARYALPADKRSIAALAKRFAKWDEARKAAKADNTPTEVEAPAEDEGDEATE